MHISQVNIRDPYILKTGEAYYLYGTRSRTCWEKSDGFDCYKSSDLKDWTGPIEIFKRPEDFWADRKFWAPECYEHDGRFYLVTTFGAKDHPSGIQVLVSESPEGPFTPWSKGPVTPADWNCIDGTLYWEEDTPYLLFSHAFEDDPKGFICAMALTKDLKAAAAEPVALISADNAPWAVPFPFAKEEFGLDDDIYFTDGPCIYTMADQSLRLIWSSWSKEGYAVGIAKSQRGSVLGPWVHEAVPLFEKNGGHGMWFTEGEKILYTLHSPNTRFEEHPVFYELIEEGDTLRLGAMEE